MDLGAFSIVVALAIACCKMLLVALFFMHVATASELTKLVVVGRAAVAGNPDRAHHGDFPTRGWIGVLGR